jgi:hypothetical protein
LTHPSIPSQEGKEKSERGVLVTLIVYDILGSEIATLVDEQKALGIYEVEFNGKGLSSGVYFYELKSFGQAQTKKMILSK